MEELLDNIRKSQYWEYLTNNTVNIDKLIAYTTQREFEKNEKILFKNILEILIKDYDIPKEYLSLRVFISSLMIYKDPDALLSKDRQDIEENLYLKSTEIYNFINNSNKDYKLLGKKLLTYKILFDEWKNRDLESQMNILCELYYRYKEAVDETPKEVINQSNKEIVNFVNKVEKSMKRLTPNYKEYIDNYKLKKVSYDDKASNLIYKKLKSTYWKFIENKIFEEKKYEIIDRIVDDYLELINDINVNDLDLSSINNHKGINSLEALVSLANEMINVNKRIDSEHYDDIYAYITEKLIKSNKYLTDIFKFVFERLEFIKNVKNTVIENN